MSFIILVKAVLSLEPVALALIETPLLFDSLFDETLGEDDCSTLGELLTFLGLEKLF